MPIPLSTYRLTTIGGGTGTFTVLNSLKNYRDIKLSAIVAVSDDGGSSGRLRNELGILPPGDIRQALVALSSDEKLMLELLNYRFTQGDLNGHTFGNLLLAALTKVSGDLKKAITATQKLFKIKGAVIPVTYTKTDLYVKLETGEIIKGETTIDDTPPAGLSKAIVKEIYLKPKVRATREAMEAIRKSDAIIIGPGDFWGSIMANLTVPGISEALKKTKAKKIFILNLMTRWGQHGFSAQTYVQWLRKYTPLDYIIVNNEKLPPAIVKIYEQDHEYPIKNDLTNNNKTIVINKPLLSSQLHKQNTSDKIKRSLLRHSSAKLGKTIKNLLPTLH